jgi:hypothetical protein
MRAPTKLSFTSNPPYAAAYKTKAHTFQIEVLIERWIRPTEIRPTEISQT